MHSPRLGGAHNGVHVQAHKRKLEKTWGHVDTPTRECPFSKVHSFLCNPSEPHEHVPQTTITTVMCPPANPLSPNLESPYKLCASHNPRRQHRKLIGKKLKLVTKRAHNNVHCNARNAISGAVSIYITIPGAINERQGRCAATKGARNEEKEEESKRTRRIEGEKISNRQGTSA